MWFGMKNTIDYYTQKIDDPCSKLQAIYITPNSNERKIFGTISLVPFEYSDVLLDHIKKLCTRSHKVVDLFELDSVGVHLSIFGPQYEIISEVLVLQFIEYLGKSFKWNFSKTKDKCPVFFSYDSVSTIIKNVDNQAARGVFEVLSIYQDTRKFLSNDMVIAIQGLGKVGMELCRLCCEAGYQTVVSDINQQKCLEAETLYNSRIVEADNLYEIECVAFCPCALGAVLNHQTLSVMTCDLIVGSAQNQFNNILLESEVLTSNKIWISELYTDPSIIAYCQIHSDNYLSMLNRLVIDSVSSSS